MKDAAETPEVGKDAPPDLKPANENPWYILMTLYGEQDGDDIDVDLHEKNRKAWNAWSGQGLNDEERSAAAKSSKIDVSELAAWPEMETEVRARFADAFAARNPGLKPIPDLPDPTQAIDLRNTRFSNTVFLEHLVFAQAAQFGSATFTQAAWFKSATFTQDARFGAATFTQDAEFHSATFDGFAHFPEVKFGEDRDKICVADFRDCQFAKPTNFRDAVFLNRYPIFSGAVLHDKTSFTAEEEHWPNGTEKLSEDDAKAARESCAVIRHSLAKQGLPEDEHFFFRREMQFARQIGSFWQRLPYHLFGIFSEYGYSIKRPLWWLFGLWAFGFAAFWGYLASCCVPKPLVATEAR
ncbi:MAG: pentapeptide repeat-containing protein [Epibacterium sp.]|nr:pentapeptide repeat-containing protein [Epibacterium sp.]